MTSPRVTPAELARLLRVVRQARPCEQTPHSLAVCDLIEDLADERAENARLRAALAGYAAMEAR